jgi:hypothetical protein
MAGTAAMRAFPPPATDRPARVEVTAYIGKPPFPSEITLAEEETPPVRVAADCCSLSVWDDGPKPPILVNCSQNLRVLEDLVGTALQVFDDLSSIFVSYWRRSLQQMPSLLLDRRVLVLQDPDDEAARLIRSSRSEILVIRNNLGVTGREAYDNTICCTLHSRRPAARRDIEIFLGRTVLHGCWTELRWTGDADP